MIMKPRSKEFKYKMSSFFLKGFIILVLVCLIRLTEFIIGPSLNNSLSWTFAGLWQDLIAAATWMVFIAPLYFVIARFFKRFADIVLAIWMTLGISLQILVIIYFSISSTALRAEHMYGMSGSQVDFLTNLYGFSWYYLLAILPLFLGVDLLLKLSEKLEKIKLIEFIASCIIIFGSLANIFWPLQESDYSSDFEFEVKANKSQVFIKSYFEYEPGEINISEKATKDALLSYYELSGIEKEEYFDYPFFSPEKSKNHLGEYFVKRDVAPNVVVIISESLCKIFSGPNARLGSFTPFLDSLIDHSLYFENCLANAERTFGAIPNLMAGVPEGDQGFMNLRSTMPDHLSLPMLLKEQEGYQTNFFCGAKKGYDYMDEYLMFQKFDNLYFEEDFEQNEIMGQLEFKNGEKRDFNWGAEDLKVFNESMQFFKRTDKNNPFFNLYLTTSFHEPYAYSDQPKFIKLAQKTIDKSKQENKDQLTSEVEALAA
ncbi:MAG: phosphoglycerol transferase MdoB-like AlkP superfamily enzyme, partial [Arenicella sp.]